MQEKYLGSAEKLNNFLNEKELQSRPSRMILEARNICAFGDLKEFEPKSRNEQEHVKDTDFKFKLIRCKSPLNENLLVPNKEKEEVTLNVAIKLGEHVKKEQKLRDLKEMFGSWRQENKWELLQSALKEKGQDLTL